MKLLKIFVLFILHLVGLILIRATLIILWGVGWFVLFPHFLFDLLGLLLLLLLSFAHGILYLLSRYIFGAVFHDRLEIWLFLLENRHKIDIFSSEDGFYFLLKFPKFLLVQELLVCCLNIFPLENHNVQFYFQVHLVIILKD